MYVCMYAGKGERQSVTENICMRERKLERLRVHSCVCVCEREREREREREGVCVCICFRKR